MAANPDVIRKDWWEGTDPGATMARLAGADRTLIQIAQIVRWDLKVIDKTVTPNAVVLTMGSVGIVGIDFFNTLQYSDGWWRHNNKGYNFRHYVKLSAFTTPPQGDHMHWLEYSVTTTDRDATPAGWGVIRFRREGLARANQT